MDELLIEIATKDMDDLETMDANLRMDILNITAQLDVASAERVKYPDMYALDPCWVARAEVAREYKKLRRDIIGREINKRRAGLQAFVDYARSKLPPDQFEQWWKESRST